MRIVEVGEATSRKAAGLVIEVAFTALALWLVFSNVDGPALWANLQKQDGAPLVIAAIATYAGLINLITGNRIRYYNGLAVHLRHNVMRWHPNTRGFGLQAEILCMLG